jgi:D-glycero-D-manno-heptose 1,7-bisphosphate phosphatase
MEKHQDERMHFIDYGVSLLSKDILDRIENNKVTDIADVLTALSKEQKLAGQVVLKRFYEIGNPDSYKEFCQYAYERFDKKRKAVFLDRDGVINEFCFNEETEQLDSPFDETDFYYKKNVIDTLSFLQRAGYYIFIVTNQPAAAKGKVSLQKLYNLSKWIIKDLCDKGIDIECINMCPHHPKGNERTEAKFLIRDCRCRKPKAALITDLFEIYNIDKENSIMIGDSYTDVMAGKTAGLKTVLLGEMKCDMCHCLHGNKPDWIIEDIAELKKLVEERDE